ncbi:cell division control protein 11 [[Candida] railenensis]|uniref:Cell division control protein 11 n=1 Tax=[Candida] railenensis TaxID=45579 RepID=A0A9P0QKU0_9ASCO|nr:cell division control protein 11 [[Candida] railenensis]
MSYNYSHDNNTTSSALRKRKTLKKSINFSVMIVGQSGSGRSTLINTICGGNSIVPTSSTINEDPFTKKLTLRHENVELEDNEGHKISLNIIDTPNFANGINCDDDFKVIVDFLRHQYDEVLLEESRVKRNPRFKDGRIHVLIYMINPTGHGLSEVDVKFMKHISSLVNIIPVIAKADSLTPKELKVNKALILEDMTNYGINYYKFNEYEYESDYIDDEIVEYNKYLNSLVPFSIIGANTYQEASGSNAGGEADEDLLKLRVLNNKYLKPINVENPEINDFTILKNVLLITHLNEFKELTHEVMYENYRTEALSGKQFRYISNSEGGVDGKEIQPPSSLGQTSANGTGIDSPALGNSILADGQDHEATYQMKEEQIKLEEERLRKFEERVHQDLINKRKELLEREQELKAIEKRLLAEGLKLNDEGDVVKI